MLTPIAVRAGDGVHPRRPVVRALGLVGHRGRDRVGGVGPAVIGLGHGDDVVAPVWWPWPAAGPGRQPRSRVDQNTVSRGRAGWRPGAARVGDRAVVEPGVGVEPAPLPGDGVGQVGGGRARWPRRCSPCPGSCGRRRNTGTRASPVRSGRTPVVLLLHAGQGPSRRRTRSSASSSAPRSRGQAQQWRRVGGQGQPAGRVLGPDECRHRRSESPVRITQQTCPARGRRGSAPAATACPVSSAGRTEGPRTTTTTPSGPAGITSPSAADSTTPSSGGRHGRRVGEPHVDTGRHGSR